MFSRFLKIQKIIRPSLFFLQALFKVQWNQVGYFLYQVLIVLKPKLGRSILCSIFLLLLCRRLVDLMDTRILSSCCYCCVFHDVIGFEILLSSSLSLLLLLLLLLHLAHCLVQTTGGSSGAQIPPLFHNWHVSDLFKNKISTYKRLKGPRQKKCQKNS